MVRDDVNNKAQKTHMTVHNLADLMKNKLPHLLSACISFYTVLGAEDTKVADCPPLSVLPEIPLNGRSSKI